MYCNIQDILDSLTDKVVAQLSNDDDPNTVNIEIVGNFINDVSSFIDGYIRTRYELPLKNEYPVIKNICIDLVKFELYKRRNKLNDTIEKLYDIAISSLEKLQKGIMVLNESINNETRNTYIKVNNQKSVYSHNLLDKYLQ